MQVLDVLPLGGGEGRAPQAQVGAPAGGALVAAVILTIIALLGVPGGPASPAGGFLASVGLALLTLLRACSGPAQVSLRERTLPDHEGCRISQTSASR